jgi:hypothetical protein
MLGINANGDMRLSDPDLFPFLFLATSRPRRCG